MSHKYDYTSSTPRIAVGTRVHHHEWGPGVAIPPTGHTHPAYTVVQYDSGRKWRTRTDCLELELVDGQARTQAIQEALLRGVLKPGQAIIEVSTERWDEQGKMLILTGRCVVRYTNEGG